MYLVFFSVVYLSNSSLVCQNQYSQLWYGVSSDIGCFLIHSSVQQEFYITAAYATARFDNPVPKDLTNSTLLLCFFSFSCPNMYGLRPV